MRTNNAPGHLDTFQDKLFWEVKKAVAEYLIASWDGIINYPMETSVRLNLEGITFTFEGWRPSLDEFIEFFPNIPLKVSLENEKTQAFLSKVSSFERKNLTAEQIDEEIKKIYDEINNPPDQDRESADDTE